MAERAGAPAAVATTPGGPPGTVILDADSTLVGIEGIDWLAARRGPAMAERIAAATAEAMAGTIGIEAVYATRLEAVAPTRDEIAALGEAYVASIAAGAQECVRALAEAGARVVIVSAGIRGALLPLARHLGIPDDEVHGVEVRHDAEGRYRDFDRATPLTRSGGKAVLVEALRLPAPITAVGDGMSDLEIKLVLPAVTFIAFTGFARRPQVIARADAEVDSFDRLRSLLLSRP